MPYKLQRLMDIDRWYIAFAHLKQIARRDQARIGIGERKAGGLIGLEHELRAEELIVRYGAELDGGNSSIGINVLVLIAHWRDRAQLRAS
jgi:outer membrane scaffolding protein for murein synthesis (MipA/OmpV family)